MGLGWWALSAHPGGHPGGGGHVPSSWQCSCGQRRGDQWPCRMSRCCPNLQMRKLRQLPPPHPPWLSRPLGGGETCLPRSGSGGVEAGGWATQAVSGEEPWGASQNLSAHSRPPGPRPARSLPKLRVSVSPRLGAAASHPHPPCSRSQALGRGCQGWAPPMGQGCPGTVHPRSRDESGQAGTTFSPNQPPGWAQQGQGTPGRRGRGLSLQSR